MTKKRNKSVKSEKSKKPKKPIVAKKVVRSTKQRKTAKAAISPKATVAGSRGRNIPRNKSQKATSTSSKKKKPTKAALRKRALAGWVTRRKFDRIAPTPIVQKLVTEVILPGASHKVGPKELIDSLSAFRMDGTEARYPSVLRFSDDVEEIAERLWAIQGQLDSDRYRAASPEEIADTPEFKREANDIANEYEVQLREVYTLFFSP